MNTMNRREVLRSLLTGALQTAGTVVLACSALPVVAAQANQGPPAKGDLQERADRLASEEGGAPEGGAPEGGAPEGGAPGGGAPGGGEVPYGAFRRGGFANGGGGGAFRRGGFANGGGGGGGFRRGGWRN